MKTAWAVSQALVALANSATILKGFIYRAFMRLLCRRLTDWYVLQQLATINDGIVTRIVAGVGDFERLEALITASLNSAVDRGVSLSTARKLYRSV